MGPRLAAGKLRDGDAEAPALAEFYVDQVSRLRHRNGYGPTVAFRAAAVKGPLPLVPLVPAGLQPRTDWSKMNP